MSLIDVARPVRSIYLCQRRLAHLVTVSRATDVDRCDVIGSSVVAAVTVTDDSISSCLRNMTYPGLPTFDSMTVTIWEVVSGSVWRAVWILYE